MHSNWVTVNGKYWTIKTHSYTMIYWRCETTCSLRNNSACPLGSSSLINQHFRHYTLSTFICLIFQSLSCPCCVFVFLSVPKTQKRSQSLSKYALLFEPEAFAQLASVHLYTINYLICLYLLYFILQAHCSEDPRWRESGF